MIDFACKLSPLSEMAYDEGVLELMSPKISSNFLIPLLSTQKRGLT